MKQHQKSINGFTIVELLIVVVVIGILAAITVVAYSSVKGRAIDSRRLDDMQTIVKALEAYKVQNQVYPTPSVTPNASGWEVSSNGTTATNFLGTLVSSGVVSAIPVDPINTADSSGAAASLNPSRGGSNKIYFYYRYPAGTNTCDPARGDFYVLGVTRFEGVAAGVTSPASPGFSCSGFNWSNSGTWVTGSYTNS